MASTYLPKIYKGTPEKKKALLEAPEQPNDEIKVKVLLTRPVSSVLKDPALNKQWNTDSMEASQVGNKNVIEVKGIRPCNEYGPQNILTAVQSFDRGARITS